MHLQNNILHCEVLRYLHHQNVKSKSTHISFLHSYVTVAVLCTMNFCEMYEVCDAIWQKLTNITIVLAKYKIN